MISDFFTLVVVTPEAILYEGTITKLTAPGIFQDIAILPDHTPLYAQLVKGNLTIYEKAAAKPLLLPIDGGVIRVKRNVASIIVGFGEEKLPLPQR